MKTAKDFSPEEKAQIVERLLKGEKSSALAKEFKVKDALFYAWRFSAMKKTKKTKAKKAKVKKLNKPALRKAGILERLPGDVLMSNLLQEDISIDHVEILRDKIILHLS